MASIEFLNKNINTYKIVANEEDVVNNYIIEAIYLHNTDLSRCNYTNIGNNSQFDIFINGVLVLNANLNNSNEGISASFVDGIGSSPYDRYASAKITPEVSKQIVVNNRYNFIMTIKNAPNNFYNTINGIWIRIRDKEGNIIYNECSPVDTEIDLLSNIAYSSHASQAECADSAKLEFVAKDLLLNSNYEISYYVIDTQLLSSSGSGLSFGINSYSKQIDQDNKFVFFTQHSNELRATISVNLDCVQSSLVKIQLKNLDSDTIIGNDVCQILCPMCSAAQHNLNFSTEHNTDFDVKIANIQSLGEIIRLTDVQDSNQNLVIKIKDTDDNNYIDLQFDNLTVNNQYKYEIFITPNDNSTIDFSPSSFTFFAGSETEIVSTKINLNNNPIVLFYVTLTDMSLDIIKHTQPIYLVNTNNFNINDINFNISFIENTKSVINTSCEQI